MYRRSDVKRLQNPRENSNIFSIIFFIFTFGLFKKASRKEIEEDDIYEVLNNTKASKLGDTLENGWKFERFKIEPSLTKLLIQTFGSRYMAYGFLNLIVKTSVMVIRPIATGKLVAYFIPNSGETTEDLCISASLVILTSIVNSIYTHYYLFSLAHFGLRVKVALCSLIYRKSLKLTTSSLSTITDGKIITLLTKDVNVFELALMYGHDLWTGCIQVLIMALVMYREIGYSVGSGILILLLLIPFQVLMGKKTKSLRLKSSTKTDERLRRIKEIITSIKVIKCYTWEKYYTNLVDYIRTMEINKLRKIFFVKAFIVTFSSFGYRISFFISIMLYNWLGNTLTPDKAFVLVACFKSLDFIVGINIPMSITQFAEARTCIKRLEDYLLIDAIDDKKPNNIVKIAKIIMKDVDVNLSNKNVLHDINFESVSPALVAITGSVASGKTTLLKTILQDLKISKGNAYTLGDISYCSQEPWLFPGTIRDNIVFGRIYDQERYQQILKVCALTQDIENLPDNDNSIISDGGLNLSKGQQARINLARAVYKESDIYLFDDILSSLDAKVSKFIFEECIKKFLHDKLCIIVCHNKIFLGEFDNVIVIENGTIKAEGNFETLSLKFGSSRSLARSKERLISLTEADTEEDSNEHTKLLDLDKANSKTKIYAENKETGKLSWDVYKTYFYYFGWKFVPLVIGVSFITEVLHVFFDFYIIIWLKTQEKTVMTYSETNTTTSRFYIHNITHDLSAYLYTLILAACVLFVLLRMLTFFGLTTRASKYLHTNIFCKIMQAPTPFFEKNLSGNIINKFSKDFAIIDDYLPYAYMEAIQTIFLLICVVLVIIYTNWAFILPIVLLAILMLYARNAYLRTSMSLKRLEGTTRAPIVGYVNSTLEGLPTIRATGNQEILINQFDRHLDLNSSASFMFLSVARTFAFWLDMLCNFFLTSLIFGFIFLQDNLAENVGLAVTQSYGIARLLQWGVRQLAEVETTTVAVERVAEYLNIPQEKLTGKDPDNWPRFGRIEYRNVNLNYANSQVLQNINFTIEANQKIGIIGRTGSGKSSLISALFRLYNYEGLILVDDEDIKDIELPIVRSKISLIPQDPVMFEGTIRSNLDPNREYTDLQIWRALEDVEFKYEVENLMLGLSTVVDNSGANFSIGQRQLFCLARAILHNNKIIILDEATANIDPHTDTVIQRTVKRLFENCTVLTIAHRINTVMNSDKIMVVDNGKVTELGTPGELLGRKAGVFYSMAKKSGLVE